jgi:hypothetical protein
MIDRTDPQPVELTPLVHPSAVVISKTEDQLRDERDALLAELDGCNDPHCPHHWAAHDQLDSVQWLLGAGGQS